MKILSITAAVLAPVAIATVQAAPVPGGLVDADNDANVKVPVKGDIKVL